MNDTKRLARAMRDRSRTLGRSHMARASLLVSEEEWLPIAAVAFTGEADHIAGMVPREPSEHMIEQGSAYGVDPETAKAVWRSMYDAARREASDPAQHRTDISTVTPT